jgi:hypothetical protein
MEPSRGHDPLSCSGDLPNQMGQRDGIEQHQHASPPRRRHHVQDCFTVVRGAMIAVNDHSDNGVRRRCAPPIFRCAGGGAGMGESQIKPTHADLRADVLEHLPCLVVKECRKFDGLGGHIKVPHGEYYSLLVVRPGLRRLSSSGGRGGGGSGGRLMVNAWRSERRSGFVPPTTSQKRKAAHLGVCRSPKN